MLWAVLAIVFKLNSKLDQPVLARILELSKAPLRSKVLMRLGGVSYPTYLIHILVIDLVMIAAKKLGYLSSDRVALFIVLSILLTYFISSLIHKWVELPFIKVGKKIAASVYSRELKCE